jgi:hypothetical protein
VPPSTFLAVADAWRLFLEHSSNCFLSLSCQRDPLKISACISFSRFFAMASKFSDSIFIANISGSVAVVCIAMVVICCLLIHLLRYFVFAPAGVCEGSLSLGPFSISNIT